MTDHKLSQCGERNTIKVFGRTLAILLAVTLSVASSAWAQTPLSDLSLEDLMKLDAGQVFGATGRPQPVIEAPSSISFITAEEIALFGYRTLADILRSVRGMYVTDDRNFSLLGIRGFAKPGDYNSRILLLVNGHRVNDNVFGQAEIGAEFGLDPAMFERVEVIRGPASSLYGDSAFFAVVNVITRTGASLAGASLTAETGTLGMRLLRATLGHQLTNGMDIVLSGTYGHSDGIRQLYFPVFDSPATNNGIAEGLDGEGVGQFYSRMAFKGLTFTGAYGTRRRDVPTASFGTIFNGTNPRQQTTDRHTLLDADYGRTFRGSHVTLRASFDRFTYDGIYALEEESGPPRVIVNNVVGTRWTVGGGLTRALGSRQTVKAGVEYIDNIRQDQGLRRRQPPGILLDSRRSSRQHAVYVQDEIRLARRFIITAGLRYDGYEEFRRVTPRAALIVLLSSRESLKYLYGNAFRAPNVYETDPFYFGEAARNLRPESIDTHELVWERYVNDWLRTSVSTYWYKADRLITLVSDDSALLSTSFRNQGEVRAKGFELEAQMRLKGAARMLMSYAIQNATDQETHAELSNSPRHMARARISLPGPTSRSFVSLEGQYLSTRKTVAGGRVSSAATLNVTFIQPLGNSWTLFGGVRNIFDSQYADPVSDAHRQDTIPQNGRTAQIGLKWTMWTK